VSAEFDIEPQSIATPPSRSPFPDGTAAVAYADGAARGNPGPAAYGCVYALADGTVLCGEGLALGRATNNVAEYRGLIAALRRLRGWKVRAATVRLDSELVVRQMSGAYRVKNAGLKPLHRQASELAAQFDSIRFEHVPRAANVLADALANLALDRAGSQRRS
jgi:ribonuclease HI